jgi:hypothetical protein
VVAAEDIVGRKMLRVKLLPERKMTQPKLCKEIAMKVYLISARPKRTYNIYYSAVVIAESPEKAARIHPDGHHRWSEDNSCWEYIKPLEPCDPQLGSWVHPDSVVVEFIADVPGWDWARVVCANFRS